MSYFYHTNDKRAKLAFSHYSDPHFDGNGAIIFGRDQKGLIWDYADRLQQWDADKSEAAWTEAVSRCGALNTALRIETYLSIYHGRPVDLKCIQSGTQRFNGYPWYAYGYVFTDEAKA